MPVARYDVDAAALARDAVTYQRELRELRVGADALAAHAPRLDAAAVRLDRVASGAERDTQRTRRRRRRGRR